MPNHICSNNRFSASSNIGSNTGNKVDQGARLGKTKRATAASAIRGQFLKIDFFQKRKKRRKKRKRKKGEKGKKEKKEKMNKIGENGEKGEKRRKWRKRRKICETCKATTTT